MKYLKKYAIALLAYFIIVLMIFGPTLVILLFLPPSSLKQWLMVIAFISCFIATMYAFYGKD